MSNANLGWLFYKDYFKNFTNKDYLLLKKEKQTENEKKYLTDILQETIGKILKPVENTTQDEPLGNIHFKATTTYPGLLLGSGYNHQLSIKEELILGFDFDYTTGLPIIRGSSIKGVLRSAFRHTEYIEELLEKKDIDIEALEIEIFVNSDIFFDATIASTSGSKILADDYLAPHGDDLLKNPIPLRFIKVAPNVIFRFDFELSDGLILKDEKRKLFQNILEDLGIGAKTNVGYGKFENFTIVETDEEKEQKLKEQKLKKERYKKELEEEQKRAREEKAKKSQGIEKLKNCKDIKIAMKIINDSLGKKPNPTSEQKSIIEAFWKKHNKKASKNEVKFFKKLKI